MAELHTRLKVSEDEGGPGRKHSTERHDVHTLVLVLIDLLGGSNERLRKTRSSEFCSHRVLSQTNTGRKVVQGTASECVPRPAQAQPTRLGR